MAKYKHGASGLGPVIQSIMEPVTAELAALTDEVCIGADWTHYLGPGGVPAYFFSYRLPPLPADTIYERRIKIGFQAKGTAWARTTTGGCIPLQVWPKAGRRRLAPPGAPGLTRARGRNTKLHSPSRRRTLVAFIV